MNYVSFLAKIVGIKPYFQHFKTSQWIISYIETLTENVLKYFIKNMIRPQCLEFIKSHLDNRGIIYSYVLLGEIEVPEKIPEHQFTDLSLDFELAGYTFITEKRAILVEKIKHIVSDLIFSDTRYPNINFSTYLCEKLKYDYTYMSNSFTKEHGYSIEHFVISQKVERIKTLLLIDMNIKEIAYQMNYSSVAHLSNQFRKVTGINISNFRKQATGTGTIPGSKL